MAEQSFPLSCPCGSGKAYAVCCGRFIDQGALPETAEQLMR
ncbi:MAG: SEC-C domain-containing protein, partial [Halothiobacillus sp.]|nr:SEC-C domain-containing protein [Halothiobacillus sp.]